MKAAVLVASLAVASLTFASLAGCADHRGDADAVNTAITHLPGVASSEVDYDSGWRRGDQRLRLTTVLADGAAPEQAKAVGATFVEAMNTKDFTGADVGLEVRYRVVDAMNHVPLTSSATFAFTDAHRPDGQTADSLREWLAVAQSPGVQSARFGERVGITVDQAATDGDLPALVRSHPGLDRATWTLVGGSPRQVSPNTPDYPEAYDVTGMVPNVALGRLWRDIVAEVGAAGEVRAETDTARAPNPTTVTLNFATPRDREENLGQAWMVLPLLEKLPQPAKVDFDGALFVFGGCSAPGTGSDLETELRQKYEKCP